MPASSKPTLPPFWKWLMRVTFAVTMVLFLAPTFYVVKYYTVDKPREEAYVTRLKTCACSPAVTMNAVVYWERQAAEVQAENRLQAIHALGILLQRPAASFRNPLECLSAKAMLAELAAKDKNPAVRAAASDELGKVAQGGAVIRR